MTIRQQIQEIPAALRKTLERARAEYGAVARKVRWGDSPLLVCGEGECLSLALKSACAFESFPGWPSIAHSAEVFQTYALPLLKPHSVLLMISAGDNRPETEELARVAKQRGCVVIVLANSAENPLVKHAHHALLITPEIPPGTASLTVCMHAALNVFAFEAAQALKRPEPQWKDVNEEFQQLPEKIEWLFAQLSPLLRSFASEVSQLASLKIVGAGFYEFPAFRAARRLQSRQNLRVEAFEATEFINTVGQSLQSGDGVLFVSGSHSKLKKSIHDCADAARARGARILSLTDGNDRELATHSDLGLLMPTLCELPSATLALFMLEWLASESARPAKA